MILERAFIAEHPTCMTFDINFTVPSNDTCLIVPISNHNLVKYRYY